METFPQRRSGNEVSGGFLSIKIVLPSTFQNPLFVSVNHSLPTALRKANIVFHFMLWLSAMIGQRLFLVNWDLKKELLDQKLYIFFSKFYIHVNEECVFF